MASLAALYRVRDALPLRTRTLFTFGAVAALHAAAVALMLAGNTLIAWLGSIDLGDAGLPLAALLLAAWGGAALASRQPRNE
ncbi:hypothetical protein FBY33_1323 [Arthrobacter sp. SLBN-112]|jgi:high-affinity nickel-transport protein|uniref:hypothetical protein n=1 Tax=Arthrobacter sp. SLBN-112 TaxID=2768452 RepID=UPI00115053FE|nr:hypothetical protein [Arthrobacter sp. SLBN-112]TQJ39308.1 hypothetical protein FBY33_1323 [Arthrobacter sp. SLBN-112]